MKVGPMNVLTTVLGDILGVLFLVLLAAALLRRVVSGPKYRKQVIARQGFHKYYTRKKLRD